MALSREELEKQMEEYGQQGGTKPAADGFIYYKFGSPSKETGGPENTDQALGAESSTVAQKLEAEPSDAELGFLDKPLLRKYKTHGDHARAFHDHPERLINDIQLACPFNLEKTACPLGEKCTLVPVCMEEDCQSSRDCGKAHLRWLCAEFLHSGKGKNSHGAELCQLMHPDNASKGTQISHLTWHKKGQDGKMQKLIIRDGGWVRAASEAEKKTKAAAGSEELDALSKVADVAAFLEDTPHALATVGGDAFESPQTAALLSQMSKLTLARNVDDKAFCAVELTNGDTFEQGEGDFSGEEQILAKITGSTLASDRKDLEKDIEVSMKRLTYYLLYSRAP